MNFEETEKIDVTKHIEKKGRFSYLSWPFAVSQFRKSCPCGRWDVTKENGSPVITTDFGHFVEVVVTPDVWEPDISFSQIHPILDNNNKPVASPTAFQVNTSIQRCLVKAIAISTGIGLHIYAGEDLPPGSTEEDNLGDKCAEYNAMADKCETAADLEGWWVQHSAKAKHELGTWYEKHKAYVADLGTVLKEKERVM